MTLELGQEEVRTGSTRQVVRFVGADPDGKRPARSFPLSARKDSEDSFVTSGKEPVRRLRCRSLRSLQTPSAAVLNCTTLVLGKIAHNLVSCVRPATSKTSPENWFLAAENVCSSVKVETSGKVQLNWLSSSAIFTSALLASMLS